MSVTSGMARNLALSFAILLGSILLLTSTTQLTTSMWPYDVKRLLQLLAMTMMLCAALFNRDLRNAFAAQICAVPTWVKRILAAIFALGTLSAFINAHSTLHLLNSLSEVVLMLLLVACVLLLAASRRIAGRLFDQIAMTMLALTAVAVGLQEVLGIFAAQSAGLRFRFEIALLHFSFPRFYNQMESWMILALAAMPLLFQTRPFIRLLAWCALVSLWFVVFLTAARGTALGVLAAICCGLLFLPQVRMRLIAGQFTTISLGVLVYILLLFTPWDQNGPGGPTADSVTDVGTAYQEQLGRPVNTSSGRLDWLWPNAWEDIQEAPYLGRGPMNYACTEFRGFGHPHNFLLQIGAEWGVLAATLLCLTVAILLSSTLGRIRRSKNPVDALLLLAVIAASVHTIFSGVMVMPASQLTGLLVVGMLVGRLSEGQSANTVALQTNRSKLIAIFLAAELSLAMLLLGVFELRTMSVRAEQLPPGESLQPRMWQDSRVCSLYVPKRDAD